MKTADTSQGIQPKIEPSNLWDKRYGRVLNSDERKEIETNLGGFFELLNKWQNELNQSD